MSHKTRRLGMWRLAAGTHAGQARGFLRVWLWYEAYSRRSQQIHSIPGSPHDLLHLRVMRYADTPITLPDGTRVARGDLVGELHFNNAALVKLGAIPIWELIRHFEDELAALAQYAQIAPELAPVSAFWGTTILSRATPRLGFTVRARPITPYLRLQRFFLRGLLAIYNPAGLARLARGNHPTAFPQDVWLARRELLRRYGA